MIENDKTIRIDDRSYSFRMLWNESWGKKITHLTEGTQLFDAAQDLALSIKSAANVCRMPWLFVEQLTAFHDGLAGSLGTYTYKHSDRLASEVYRHFLESNSQIDSDLLVEAFRNVFVGRRILSDSPPIELRGQEVWKGYLQDQEFLIILWSSQRIGYPALFFAYEDFLTTCYRMTVGKDDSWRMNPRSFKNEFEAAFDRTLYKEFWSNDRLLEARLVRHAIVHNGGRLTADLENLDSPLSITSENGELHVLPQDSGKLLQLLQGKSLRLAEETLKRIANS